MKPPYLFTPADDAAINSMRTEGAAWKAIAAKLNFPEWSVRNRATVLNLPCLALSFRAKTAKLKRASHEWTEEQDAILMENWGKIEPGEIGNLVGKSRGAVMSHAVSLKLRTPNPANSPIRPRSGGGAEEAPRALFNREVLPPGHEVSWGALLMTMDPAWIAARLS